MKKIMVSGIIISCIWLMYAYPDVMINPGKLVEGHQKIHNQCQSCHTPFWGVVNSSCISCHKLSEIGKDTFPNRDTSAIKSKILFHQSLSNQSCTSCHTDHKGLNPERTISQFKHELLAQTMLNQCNSCHGKPSDKIHLQISSSCNRCHTTQGWKSQVRFNHEMIEGVDQTSCTTCHQKPNDSYHLLLKDNCSKCHRTNQWVPSSFDHSSYFVLDQNHNAKCSTCHTTASFASYTCYGCHEHSQNSILEEHAEHRINNLENCVACHKSGNEHDIKSNGNSSKELNQQDLKNTKDYMNRKEREGKKNDDDD